MATDIERLIVALEARTKAFENAMVRANGIADKRAKAIETRFAKMTGTLSRQFSLLSSTSVQAFAAIGGAKGLQTFIDAATKIQNALKVAGLAGEEQIKTYDALFASAQRNAAPLESLVQLYSRVAINQKELGVSSERIVGLTDNVGKSLRLQGSNAEEASGALLQLAQALGSGTVQAEEYGSLIDGLPGILQAAAAGIQQAGGSVNKLTQLVKSGKISNKAFFDGIEAGSYVLDQRLANSTITIDQRFTKLQNTLIDAAKRFNENVDVSRELGGEFDRLTRFIDNIDFSALVADITAVNEAMREGAQYVNSYFEAFGKFTGAADVGKALVNSLPGDTTVKSYLGGSLVIKQSDLITDRINDAFSSQIEKAGELTADAVRKSVLGEGGPASPKGGRLAASSRPGTVNIDDAKYKPTGATTGKQRLDEYEREVKQITERTKAINAATAAQAALNPLINDYGYATERASAAQDLLSAAQAAGIAAGKELKDVQQLLSGNFDGLSPKAREQAEAMLQLANSQAAAVAGSDRLAESQDRLRDAVEGWRDFSKDATKGFIDDLVQGKGAVDALTGALGKLGDKFLGDALDGIFGQAGSGNWFTSLFSGGVGGFIAGARAGGGPVKKGQTYVVGEKRAELFVPDQDGTILPQVPTWAPTMPDLSGSLAGAGAFSLNFAPVIHAPNADAAGLEAVRRELAQMKADLPGQVIGTVKNAQKRRML